MGTTVSWTVFAIAAVAISASLNLLWRKTLRPLLTCRPFNQLCPPPLKI